jgi:hypothetical protein
MALLIRAPEDFNPPEQRAAQRAFPVMPTLLPKSSEVFRSGEQGDAGAACTKLSGRTGSVPLIGIADRGATNCSESLSDYFDAEDGRTRALSAGRAEQMMPSGFRAWYVLICATVAWMRY